MPLPPWFQALIDAIVAAVVASPETNPWWSPKPPDPLYYGLLFLVLVVLLFEHRKILYMLFFILAFLMFGYYGIGIAVAYWFTLMPVQLALDFFSIRRRRY